jgi:hypothetical protein
MLVYRAADHVRSASVKPVDILARDEDGQTAKQFVAFAVHPDTGRPYRWLGADPHDVTVTELPAVTAAQVAAFLLAVERHVGRGAARAGGDGARGALAWQVDPATAP